MAGSVIARGPKGIALVLAAIAAGACAKGEGGGAQDAAVDASICEEGRCEFEGNCSLPTVCHPVYPGLVCAAGEWMQTCGNGRCDCGERPGSCDDCACEANTCADGNQCVAAETCKSDGTPNLCRAGTWVSSCGDDVCNCGETLDTCLRDCPPEEPFWSECIARTGQYDSCDAYCSFIGLRCNDACMTTLRRPNWGAESWPEGDNCEGQGTSQALCADEWADRMGAEPHWKCCCDAP